MKLRTNFARRFLRNGMMQLALVGIVAVAAITAGGLLAEPASATHSWNNYHWARTSNPFTLQLSSNLNGPWPAHLAVASTDWSSSSVLNTTVIAGNKNPKTCKATLGRVEVCNASYGRNGWLGLAQIWLNGDHITQGTSKMNDTYFQMSAYNNSAERQHVMCQEVGHTFGLGHQDETGAALGTCMDYSSDPGSQHPNQHDYDELSIIYSHLDSTTTVGASVASAASRDSSDLNSSANWGRRVYRAPSGYFEVYEKSFRDGSKLVSLVSLAR